MGGRHAMPDHPSYRRALRLLEDEIARLKNEVQRQQDAIAVLPGAFWQAYVAHVWLTATRLQLVLLLAQRRRLRGEL
jgi:hypothetical protein